MSVSINGSGQVPVQILSVTSAVPFTATGTANTYYPFTGLSITITPSSASNKLLLIANLSSGTNANGTQYFSFVRGSTAVGVGSGGTYNMTQGSYAGSTNSYIQVGQGMTYLDSPATTSPVTYYIQVGCDSGGTIYYNRRGADTSFGMISTFTIMEISGT